MIKIKRKASADEDIPLSSTADIAFLLIVFFLAASALLEFRGIRIPLPRPDAPPMQIETKNLFRVEVRKTGELRYEGRLRTLKDIQEAMRESYKTNKALVIVLRVDPEAPSESVPRIVKQVQEEGIRRISIGMERVP